MILFIIALLLGLPQARAHDPILKNTVELTEDIPWEVLNPPIACPVRAPTSNEPKSANALAAEALSSWSCESLFAEKAPLVMQANGATKEPWFPFCTLNQIELTRAHKKVSYKAALTDSYVGSNPINGFPTSQDIACPAPSSSAPVASNGPYVPPTQNSKGLRPMTQEERSMRARAFYEIRDEIMDLCCANQSGECRDAMKRIEIRWCVPEKNEFTPDPCTEEYAHFDHSSEDMAAFKSFESDPQSNLDALNKIKGLIVLPPFARLDGGVVSTDRVIAHEFGHACSSIKRRLAMRSGQADVADQFLNSYQFGGSCEITPRTAKVYKDMFASYSATNDQFDCILNMAKNATVDRFTGHPCPKRCQTSYLEETFADWMSVASMPTYTYFDHVLGESCVLTRDTLHPLFADEFACFLKNPIIRYKAEKLTRCK